MPKLNDSEMFDEQDGYEKIVHQQKVKPDSDLQRHRKKKENHLSTKRSGKKCRRI